MPKGMAGVKRDGDKMFLGDGDRSSAQSFHARAAAAVLEAYLGRHGGTESHALTLIAVGAAVTLAALVALVVSEVSIVTLVRSEATAAAAKQAAEGGGDTEAMGGAKDFSLAGEAGGGGGAAATGFGSAAYLPYRPYVTLASMVYIYVCIYI
jgi:hypothetical protein